MVRDIVALRDGLRRCQIVMHSRGSLRPANITPRL
jgi:hypothetical protein